MVNTLQIKRSLAGEAVALHLKGQTGFNEAINRSIALAEIKLSSLVNGETTVTFAGDLEPITFTVTLDTHLHDPDGMPGKVAYDILTGLTAHTLHPHSREITPTRTLAEEGINNLGLSVANIFGRLTSVEKTLGMDEKPFSKWIVRKGREFQCEMANREDGIASVVLPTNYIARSFKFNDDPNDTRQLLRIVTNDLGILQIITAIQELGAIQDALNANADVPVHSAVHTVTT